MLRTLFLFAYLMLQNSKVWAQTDTTNFYRSENVIFFNGDSSIRFGGTLTIPINQKIRHTVVLISGTGIQDRDGTMAGTKVFAQIAHHLSRNGIAVLRTDDRESGETTGRYDSSSTEDFADDALNALNYLKTRNDIPNRKFGLIGHSEGAATAVIAASKSKRISFLISLAGLAAPGLEALIAQNESIVNSTPGISENKKRRLNQLNHLIFTTAHTYATASDSLLAAMVRETYDSWRASDDSLLKGQENGFADRIMYPIDRYIYQATGKWYRFHINYNPEKYLPKLKIPVLAINGDQDVYVPAATHLPYFEKLVKARGSSVKTVILPHTNHLFHYCPECQLQEFSKGTWYVSETVLNNITNWIASLK